MLKSYLPIGRGQSQQGCREGRYEGGQVPEGIDSRRGEAQQRYHRPQQGQAGASGLWLSLSPSPQSILLDLALLPSSRRSFELHFARLLRAGDEVTTNQPIYTGQDRGAPQAGRST